MCISRVSHCQIVASTSDVSLSCYTTNNSLSTLVVPLSAVVSRESSTAVLRKKKKKKMYKKREKLRSRREYFREVCLLSPAREGRVD